MCQKYFDYNATTPPSAAALEWTAQNLNSWGNPSAAHAQGQSARALLLRAREQVAELLGAKNSEVFFTASATEANNWVLSRCMPKKSSCQPSIIASQVEHPSVLKCLEQGQKQGRAKIHWVPLKKGQMDLGQFECMLQKHRPHLVSIMSAHNETGVLFDITTLCQMAHEHGAWFHCDAVQSLGKVPMNLKAWGVDFASFSAHKFYAFPGAGVLYKREGVELEPMLTGGGQERGLRSGTENWLAIGAMGATCAKHGAEIASQQARLEKLRTFLESAVLSIFPQAYVVGAHAPRLPNTAQICLPGVHAESLVMALDLEGFKISAGAACASGKMRAYSSLENFGVPVQDIDSCVRISLGWGSNKHALLALLEKLEQLKTRFVKKG